MSATTDLIIAPATLEDASAIASLGRTTFTTTFAHSMPAPDLSAYLSRTYTPAAIALEISDTRSNTFYVARLASAPGTIAGFLQVKYQSTDPALPPRLKLAEVHRIYVNTEVHSQGVGGKLMEHVLGILRREGSYEGAWLGVWEEHVRAKRFYARCGFTEKVGMHQFTIGECVQWDDILLCRF